MWIQAYQIKATKIHFTSINRTCKYQKKTCLLQKWPLPIQKTTIGKSNPKSRERTRKKGRQKLENPPFSDKQINIQTAKVPFHIQLQSKQKPLKWFCLLQKQHKKKTKKTKPTPKYKTRTKTKNTHSHKMSIPSSKQLMQKAQQQ